MRRNSLGSRGRGLSHSSRKRRAPSASLKAAGGQAAEAGVLSQRPQQDSISAINRFILGNPDAFTSEEKRERLGEIMGDFVQANLEAANSPHLHKSPDREDELHHLICKRCRLTRNS